MSALTKDPDKRIADSPQVKAPTCPHCVAIERAARHAASKKQAAVDLAALRERYRKQDELIDRVKAAVIEHARAYAPLHGAVDGRGWRPFQWVESVLVKVLDAEGVADRTPPGAGLRAQETTLRERTYRCRAIVTGRACGDEYEFSDVVVTELTKIEEVKP